MVRLLHHLYTQQYMPGPFLVPNKFVGFAVSFSFHVLLPYLGSVKGQEVSGRPRLSHVDW